MIDEKSSVEYITYDQIMPYWTFFFYLYGYVANKSNLLLNVQNQSILFVILKFIASLFWIISYVLRTEAKYFDIRLIERKLP